MIPIPGPIIRMNWVAHTLAELSAEFDIRCIAYDRYRIKDLKAELADIACAVALEERGQGWKDASPDIEVLIECALTGRLRHGGQPVLRAAISNAILDRDPTDSVKIAKDKSNRRGPVRVDGAVALAMALGLATRTPAPKRSIYETRGLLII